MAIIKFKSLFIIVFIAFLSTIKSYSQVTTVVNYDFNSGGSYSTFTPSLAASVTSSVTSTEAFLLNQGVASGTNAFTPNTTAGKSMGMSNSAGTNTRYFQFALGGANLSLYYFYKIYFQAQSVSTGATTLTIAYSTNGTTFTNFSTTRTPGVGSYNECQFDLSGITSLNSSSTVYFRILASGASGGGGLSVDNFQVRATKCITPANVSAGSTKTITCISPSVTLTGSTTTSGVTYSWSPGSITTSTYAASTAGTYTVKITDGLGCSASATTAVFTNTTPPNANAGPTKTITCSSPTVTLVGGSTTPGVYFSWSPGGSSPFSSSTSVSVAGIYTLHVLDGSNSCSANSTVAVVSNTTIPNVNAGSTKTITCSSASVTLTGSSSTGGATYSWTPGGSTPTASTTVVSAVGTYTLKVTDPSNGCTADATVSVVSNTTLPNANAGSTKTITCSSPTVTLTGSSSTSGATYSWTPGGSTPTASTTVVSAAGTYTLKVTDPANGCTASATVSVISNAPIPNVSAGSTKTITCSFASVTLTGSSSTGGVTYSWTPGGSTPTASTTVVSVAGTYTLKVTDPANGCTASATVSVVSNTTLPNVSAGSTKTITCSSASVTLTGSSSTGGVTYYWTPGGSTPTASTTVVSAVGTYTLKVTDPTSGCSASSTVSVVSNTALPSVDAGSTQTITCSSPTVTIGGASGGGRSISFLWTPGGSTPTSPTTDVSSPGIYTLTSTNGVTGCSASATVAVVSNTTAPTVSISVPSLTICAGSSTTLTATGASTYIWDNGTATNTTVVIPTVATTYTVIGTGTNGCISTQTITINTINLMANAGPATVTNVGSTVGLGGSPSATGGSGSYSYAWLPSTSYSPSSTSPNPTVTVSSTTVFSLTVTDLTIGCTNTAVKIVYIGSPYYFVVKKVLDAGYYDSYNKKIYFAFEEEYEDPAQNLDYTIVDDKNVLITSTPSEIEVIGDNRYTLNLASISGLTAGYFYRIAITNDKKEVFYARFKY